MYIKVKPIIGNPLNIERLIDWIYYGDEMLKETRFYPIIKYNLTKKHKH